MNIEGLDYNTQREKLILPDYGREIQNMVDYCVALKDKEERQKCAEAIVAIMDRMYPQNRATEDYEQRLWDHLAIMSDFQLDIDFPFDVSGALKMATKPEPIEYPMKRIPVKHYGNMVFELFKQLETMPDGEERDELIRLTANQMKRDLVLWGHGSIEDERVADDLARYTNGKIQLDLSTFKFEKINPNEGKQSGKKKK